MVSYSAGAKGTPYGCTSGGVCTTLSDSVTFGSDDANYNPDVSSNNGYIYIRMSWRNLFCGAPNSAMGNVRVLWLENETSNGWGRREKEIDNRTIKI